MIGAAFAWFCVIQFGVSMFALLWHSIYWNRYDSVLNLHSKLFSTSLIKNIFFIVNFRICPPCKTPFCQFFSRDSVSSFLRMPVVLIETLDLWGKCSMTTAVSSNCKMSLQNIYPSSWLKKYTSKNTRF